jgi:hypothetical protein
VLREKPTERDTAVTDDGDGGNQIFNSAFGKEEKKEEIKKVRE